MMSLTVAETTIAFMLAFSHIRCWAEVSVILLELVEVYFLNSTFIHYHLSNDDTFPGALLDPLKPCNTTKHERLQVRHHL